MSGRRKVTAALVAAWFAAVAAAGQASADGEAETLHAGTQAAYGRALGSTVTAASGDASAATAAGAAINASIGSAAPRVRSAAGVSLSADAENVSLPVVAGDISLSGDARGKIADAVRTEVGGGGAAGEIEREIESGVAADVAAEVEADVADDVATELDAEVALDVGAEVDEQVAREIGADVESEVATEIGATVEDDVYGAVEGELGSAIGGLLAGG